MTRRYITTRRTVCPDCGEPTAPDNFCSCQHCEDCNVLLTAAEIVNDSQHCPACTAAWVAKWFRNNVPI